MRTEDWNCASKGILGFCCMGIMGDPGWSTVRSITGGIHTHTHTDADADADAAWTSPKICVLARLGAPSVAYLSLLMMAMS